MTRLFLLIIFLNVSLLLNALALGTECNQLKDQLSLRQNAVSEWFKKNKKSDLLALGEAKSLFTKIVAMPSIHLDEILKNFCFKVVKNVPKVEVQEFFQGKSCYTVVKNLWPSFLAQMNHETGWFLSKLGSHNNFAGLHHSSFVLRPRVDVLNLSYTTTPWVDNGNNRVMMSFASVDEGIAGLLAFYFFPRKYKGEKSVSEYLYQGCIKDASLTLHQVDALQMKDQQRFLNCVGLIWAEAGSSGDYGDRAVGKGYENLKFLLEFQKYCQIK